MDNLKVPCEICGKPATSQICDTKEIPSEDEWTRWEIDGTHFFCDEHYRKSVVKRLPGRDPLPSEDLIKTMAKSYESVGLERGIF